MATLALTNRWDDMDAQTLMLVALSVALICSACLVLQRHQRPLGAAFELGYDLGRRDAIREGTKRSNVTELRPRARDSHDRSIVGL
jgi:hypothetical protein